MSYETKKKKNPTNFIEGLYERDGLYRSFLLGSVSAYCHTEKRSWKGATNWAFSDDLDDWKEDLSEWTFILPKEFLLHG